MLDPNHGSVPIWLWIAMVAVMGVLFLKLTGVTQNFGSLHLPF
jgi:hypothetical protein